MYESQDKSEDDDSIPDSFDKSEDDDSIPDSFDLSYNQDNNSTRDNTDSSSEDSYIKITKNSVLTIDSCDSITNENQNTNLTIDSCDSITNEKQYTEIGKIKLQPNIDKINHTEFKSNITALAFFPKILVILTLTLLILFIKIINRHNLKDLIYYSTNKF